MSGFPKEKTGHFLQTVSLPEFQTPSDVHCHPIVSARPLKREKRESCRTLGSLALVAVNRPAVLSGFFLSCDDTADASAVTTATAVSC